MKKCPVCGFKTKEGRFCLECGTELINDDVCGICPVCGKEVTSKFCPDCGAEIVSDGAGKVTAADAAPGYAGAVSSTGGSTDEGADAYFKKRVVNAEKKKRRSRILIIAGIAVAVGVIMAVIAIAAGSGDNDYDNSGDSDYGTEEEYSDDTDDSEEEDLGYGEFTKASDYKIVAYDKLARTPDKYDGKKVKFRGKVLQVIEGDDETDLRVAVDDDWDDIIYVCYDSSITPSRVLEDDVVDCYGVSGNLYTYESTNGGDITIPLVYVQKIVVK